MKTKEFYLSALIVMFLSSGCASIVNRGKYENIFVETNPAGAEATAGNTTIITPETLNLTRSLSVNIDVSSNRYIQKMLKKSSRTLLSSGGNEPVSDSGGEGHSVFTQAFLAGLQEMDNEIFTAEQLFYRQIKERVAGSAEQTPEYSVIRNSGHKGGDFVFKKSN